MKSIIRALQAILTAIAAYGAYQLVMEELSVGGICPAVLGIPACYITAVCIAMIILSYFAKKWHALFSLGTSIAWSLAAFGSYYQYKGMAECPKTADGTPTCYIALGIFSALFLLDIIHGKLRR